jgi:hypothetical protein
VPSTRSDSSTRTYFPQYFVSHELVAGLERHRDTAVARNLSCGDADADVDAALE